MKRPYEITAIFRRTSDLEVATLLSELYQLLPEFIACSPKLDDWFLKGNTKAEASFYKVFDSAGPTAAAIAVLTESLKQDVDPRIVSIWNGRDGSEGASVQYVARPAPETSMVVLRAKPGAFTKDWQTVADVVIKFSALWRPAAITVESAGYFDQRVFKDRPGLGWMLYLPKVLTVQQIPEARALLPVIQENKTQIGTIVVSVTDAAFSDENPEHISIANSIEIRMADQDLLPRYGDL
jgi:hypothetical protein